MAETSQRSSDPRTLLQETTSQGDEIVRALDELEVLLAEKDAEIAKLKRGSFNRACKQMMQEAELDDLRRDVKELRELLAHSDTEPRQIRIGDYLPHPDGTRGVVKDIRRLGGHHERRYIAWKTVTPAARTFSGFAVPGDDSDIVKVGFTSSPLSSAGRRAV